MFNPSARAKQQDGSFVGEFWDCYRLEPAQVKELCGLYEAHRAGGGRLGMAIDMGGVSFAGSSSLASLVSVRRNGTRIVLFNVDPNVREVFRVSGLEPLFLFAADQAEALRKLEDPSAGQSPPLGQPTANPATAPPRPAQGPLSRFRGKQG